MNDFLGITLITQAISAVFIAWLLRHFAQIYQQNYLYYWSYSFFTLTLYLLCAHFGLTMIDLGFDASSTSRLINLFVLSTAGYLQIAFLVIGTLSLVNNTNISNQTLVRLLVICFLIAAFITLFKGWTDYERNLRHLVRVGIRYFVAGFAFLSTAIYILRKDPNPMLGKKLVTVGFFIYGFEMAFLGWLSFENYIFAESRLLSLLIPYHGLFELLVYPLIGISLVMWLLEVERYRSQQSLIKLQNLNQTDGLTALPNQQALQKHINSWLQIASPKERLTLTLFGADQMQRINDAAGIKKGDELMVLIAKRLVFLCTGFCRFFGRLHGDVFAVVMEGHGKKQLTKSETLRKSLSKPFVIDNKSYHIEMSAGVIQLRPENTLEEVLHHASQALQVAKQQGGKQLQIYNKNIKLELNPDLSFEHELRDAFKLNQFELHYQPIWSAHNQIICFEALIRWNHPDRGLLSPASFLYLIQQLGLMVELDQWVIEHAICQVSQWQQTNPNAAKITINISADTIQNSQLVNYLDSCLQNKKVNAKNITIEVTENTAIHNIESGKNTLDEIQKLGLNIAIDDFGTGYSSLNYLRTFPADVIKFDRSFVAESGNQKTNQEILKALIPLCHRLGKKVIVEGIENKQQFDWLKKLAINGYQGFYLSHPINQQEAHKLLKMSKRQH